MTTFESGDLVEVPFPFIDSQNTKLRPALVLSTPDFQRQSGACILAMITSAERNRWGNDFVLESWAEAGLQKPSLVRWKVFTLDDSLIVRRRGRLKDNDLARIRDALAQVFSGWSLPG
ncbi:MAG: type II toxin-antitoxin system PemK/MazF family toxin [Spirochaetales bacterium]